MSRRRTRTVVTRYALATCAVAVVVCVVAAVVGHGRNVPLILLAAPVVGLLGATALAGARSSDGDKRPPSDPSA